MLPKMNGFERLRAHPRRPEVARDSKILMLTAKGRDTEVARGLRLGADAYVTKPFSTKDLVAQMNQLLGVSALSARGADGSRTWAPSGRRATLSMYSPLSAIIRRPAVTVPLDATVREALERMERARAGFVVVTDRPGEIPLGIFTLHDLVRRVTLPGGRPAAADRRGDDGRAPHLPAARDRAPGGAAHGAQRDGATSSWWTAMAGSSASCPRTICSACSRSAWARSSGEIAGGEGPRRRSRARRRRSATSPPASWRRGSARSCSRTSPRP